MSNIQILRKENCWKWIWKFQTKRMKDWWAMKMRAMRMLFQLVLVECRRLTQQRKFNPFQLRHLFSFSHKQTGFMIFLSLIWPLMISHFLHPYWMNLNFNECWMFDNFNLENFPISNFNPIYYQYNDLISISRYFPCPIWNCQCPFVCSALEWKLSVFTFHNLLSH